MEGSALDAVQGKRLNDAVIQIVTDMFDNIYPVGSIYMSATSTSPEILFGGTWKRLENQFLLGASSGYEAGSTGGVEKVALNINEIPSHTHTFTGSGVTSGYDSPNHTHSISITSGGSGSHNHTVGMTRTGYQDNNNGFGLTVAGSYANRVITSSSSPLDNTSTAANHTHSISGNTGGVSASHQHTVTAAGTNSSTGGSQSHNNMPPYLSVYMWQRIA